MHFLMHLVRVNFVFHSRVSMFKVLYTNDKQRKHEKAALQTRRNNPFMIWQCWQGLLSLSLPDVLRKMAKENSSIGESCIFFVPIMLVQIAEKKARKGRKWKNSFFSLIVFFNLVQFGNFRSWIFLSNWPDDEVSDYFSHRVCLFLSIFYDLCHFTRLCISLLNNVFALQLSCATM